MSPPAAISPVTERAVGFVAAHKTEARKVRNLDV